MKSTNSSLRKTAAMSATAIGLAASLLACSTVTTIAPDGRRTTRSVDDFRQYVESVFRRQNRLGDMLIELATADDAPDPAAIPGLLAAEERMHAACKDLNEAAATMAEGGQIGLGLRMKIVDTVARCDYVTNELDLALNGLYKGRLAADLTTR